jgi:alpha-methylacyl-CoA racemase
MPDEVLRDPHVRFRQTYVDEDGLVQPAPAPRFGATPLRLPGPAPLLGQDSRALLEGLGLDASAIEELVDAGVVGVPPTAMTD